MRLAYFAAYYHYYFHASAKRGMTRRALRLDTHRLPSLTSCIASSTACDTAGEKDACAEGRDGIFELRCRRHRLAASTAMTARDAAEARKDTLFSRL